MKILAKLLTAFLSLACICGFVGVLGILELRGTTHSLAQLSNETIPTLNILNSINMEILKIKVALRSIAHPDGFDDQVYLARQRENIAAARKAYAEYIEAFEKLPKVPEEERLWKEVKDLIPKVKPYTDEVVALAGKAEKAPEKERPVYRARLYQMISGDERLIFDNFTATLDKVIGYDQKYYAKELPAQIMAAAKSSILGLLLVTIVALLVAIALGIMLGTSISDKLKKAVSALDKIAAGDTSARLVVKSKDEFLQVAGAVEMVSTTIDALVNETVNLSAQAMDGQLSARGNADKFKGGYRGIVEGLNGTLDAVIKPLTLAANYIDRISKGDIPEKITDEYRGDFNLLKNNLNTCIDAVSALIRDADALAKAAIDGQLSVRSDVTLHNGDFRKIIEGFNKTLDLVIEPINETIALFKRMADGDFNIAMNGNYKGDFDILKTALNNTIESINEVLGQVTVAVEQVSAGSGQVSQASQALSQGATEQASSLEEITSSVTEIASQTRQNTENSVKVNTLAKDAKQTAEEGDAQMKGLVSAMQDINNSAEEIKKIVKAIDDISFQINLLALNANVEAARAGKYGKGFAVVAEEVRNLAVRSAGSVKETTAMVDLAIANIGKGNELVEKTATQLASIVNGSAQVAMLAEEVSVASREQSQGLEQITTGLSQIDQVTQSNTASAEESASAAEELSSQAQHLKGMVKRFALRESSSKMSDAQMLAALRSQMHAPAEVAPVKNPIAVGAAALRRQPIRPSEIVSLDDDDFGKF